MICSAVSDVQIVFRFFPSYASSLIVNQLQSLQLTGFPRAPKRNQHQHEPVQRIMAKAILSMIGIQFADTIS